MVPEESTGGEGGKEIKTEKGKSETAVPEESTEKGKESEKGNGIMLGETRSASNNNINEIKRRIIKTESLYPENLEKLGESWQTRDKMLSNQEEELSFLRIEIVNLQALIFKNFSMKAGGISKKVQDMMIQVEEEWSTIRQARYHSTVEGCMVTIGKMCTRSCYDQIVNGKHEFKKLTNELLREIDDSKSLMLQCDLRISAKQRYEWIGRL